MTLTVRNATLDDVKAMTDIYHESVKNGTASYELTPPDLAEMTRRFENNTRRNYPYLVAQESAVVLGYAYAGPFRERPAYRWCVEDSIYLSPQARGRGVGLALLKALVQRCEELGFRQVIAVIGGSSPASIGIHRKVGFKDAGMLKATGYKHGQWLDTVFMQLQLGEGCQTDPDLNSYPGTLYSS